jgi:2'-5' RNA ligase
LNNPGTIRTFVALPADADARRSITGIQSELKSARADVRWEQEDKFHITLKFLGNVGASAIEPLGNSLAECISIRKMFNVSFDSLGVFPNARDPRVVWIGTAHNKTLMDLQSAVEQTCSGLGFPIEKRAFHPHVTLGRVKSGRESLRLTEAIKTVTFEPIQSECREVLLVKSNLHPVGSVYTILKSFSLQT